MANNRYKYIPPTEKELTERDLERTRKWQEQRAKAGKRYEYRVVCSSGWIEGRGVTVTL